MQVLYKCACMAAEASVEVPERKALEDVVYWVEQVAGRAISDDHRRRSPTCSRVKMEYAKIPLEEGAPGVGHKATRH